MDDLDDFMTLRPPTARRPLLGLTVLVVEDSRFACEAVRLLCLRSGARIRRADSLEHAQKHLGVYRPAVLIVDVGLPDGSGLDLIESCAAAHPRIDVILGTSGDADAQGPVMAAGANGFLAKPVANLSAFQAAILMHLPQDRHPPGPRMVTDEVVHPDMLAYHDDLSHVVNVIGTGDGADNGGGSIRAGRDGAGPVEQCRTLLGHDTGVCAHLKPGENRQLYRAPVDAQQVPHDPSRIGPHIARWHQVAAVIQIGL